MNWNVSIFIVAFTVVGPFFSIANADEQMTPLAEGGDWVAISHSDSMTDAPDVCVAFDPIADLAFRTDTADNEVRYGNKAWSLPDNVTGTIDLKINAHDYPLDIESNTNNQVTAEITDDQLEAIAADMNVSSSMTVQAGSGPPTSVSLVGSNAVITAYLTCGNKKQPGSTGGTNPFGSGPTQ